MTAFRFVVSVDVEAETLPAAYRALLKRMSGNDWESTDEAYGADGEPVPGPALKAARLISLGTLSE